ncbi:hypothetical protein [Neobacillus niacini]|uniref:hypothetical protein n=1 Tax=Neobacillus niacini TaxID=86668 RepID=UPI0005ED6060|nr:hypothetical protein [Neobacillus niacini]
MNFETKYLIRWGIPGWVFTTWILIAAFSVIDPLTDMLINEMNFIKIFGLLVTSLSIGVPVGYLFHQLYFSWEWISKERFFFFFKRIPSKKFLWFFKRREPYKFLFLFKRPKTLNSLEPIKEKIENYQDKGSFHEDYYYIEFYWHKLLLSAEEQKRNYIIDRYRYFLSTIHGLGSLLYSLATSFVLSFFFYFGVDNLYKAIGLSLIIFAQLLLMIGTYQNYKYYSKNLIAFQANFIEEMLKDEKSKNENDVEPKYFVF